jgi:hypothetical protein
MDCSGNTLSFLWYVDTLFNVGPYKSIACHTELDRGSGIGIQFPVYIDQLDVLPISLGSKCGSPRTYPVLGHCDQ